MMTMAAVINEGNIDNGDDGVDRDDNRDLSNAFIFWNGDQPEEVLHVRRPSDHLLSALGTDARVQAIPGDL